MIFLCYYLIGSLLKRNKPKKLPDFFLPTSYVKSHRTLLAVRENNRNNDVGLADQLSAKSLQGASSRWYGYAM